MATAKNSAFRVRCLCAVKVDIFQFDIYLCNDYCKKAAIWIY